MFQNRVPHMLDDDYTPHSALDIFVKDLGIIASEAKRLKIPVPIAASALQQFVQGTHSIIPHEQTACIHITWLLVLHSLSHIWL
jgi:putative dehydrogenase